MRISKRGEEIRRFILDNVGHHPIDIAGLTAYAFDISRQAVNKQLQRMAKEKVLLVRGTARNRHYALHPLVQWEQIYPLDGNLQEDLVWRKDIRPLLGELPDNVIDIWHYGSTEMLNNAIDHSSGKNINVKLEKIATTTEITIYDDGEGIFKKIQRELGLDDERHAVLELAKGKLTTDPENHTGEGIFFASRMFDDFAILSGNVHFSHARNEVEDWIMENQKYQTGTIVWMKLSNTSQRMIKQIFDSFAADENYGFTKTVVPVRLAQYDDEKLISRSQAKRLLDRIDKFKVVILDFAEVETIGQAFADEIFRVFRRQHPAIEIVHLNANDGVRQMISRAEKHPDC